MTAITGNSSKSNTHFLSYLLALGISATWIGCAKMPAYTHYPSSKITTGAGPEDMVLDTLTDKEKPRLLVSCTARRKTEAPHGEIWSVDLNTEQAAIFPRKGEPKGLGPFRPHGIDLARGTDGTIHLFVVNHQDSLKRQIIMEYEVKKDFLQFLAAHEHSGILTSPNDVCTDHNGGFYWSNDASTRSKAFVEPVFRIKGGYVGRRSAGGNWAKSKSRFAYTNGIGVLNNDVYISTVIQAKVFRFGNQDLSAKPELICKLPGGDNITFTPNGRLLVTAHLRQIKFLRHLKKSENKSPSVVYLVNPSTKERKVVYADDGSTISTASTAIWYNGYLYVCQVFDGFIIKAETGTL